MSNKNILDEEPMKKRLRHRIISDHIYNEEFEELVSKNWSCHNEIKNNNLEVISTPFRVCKISNFLANEDFINELKNELLDVKYRRNILDLYQFEQSDDLEFVDKPNVQLLYAAFQIEIAMWMERVTRIPLNNKISMSSSCYCNTDYLLCHDDNMGERRIAYILYLSKNWIAEDGGTLDLFDTDEDGLPQNVVRSLIPEYNSLVFFEVMDTSFHQVSEVISTERTRWSLNGWFEGSLRQSNRLPRPILFCKYTEPMDMEIKLESWVRGCYLESKMIDDIQKEVEVESYAFLSSFFIEDVYNKLSAEITSESISWEKVGPADVRNYEVADENTLPALLKSFCDIFKSKIIFRLLRNYTELDLVSMKPDMKPKMTMELQRWSQGSYTLITDRLKNKSNEEENQMEEKVSDTKNKSKKSLDGKEIKEKELMESFTSTDSKCSIQSTSDNKNSFKSKNSISMEFNNDNKSSKNNKDSTSKQFINTTKSYKTNKDSKSKRSDNKSKKSTDSSKKETYKSENLESSKSSEDSQSTRCSCSNKIIGTTCRYCSTLFSDKEYEDIEEEEVPKLKKKKYKKVRPKNVESQTSSSGLENSPSSFYDILDRSDSDEVSDIGDYLSDPSDYDMESQNEMMEEEEEEDEDEEEEDEEGTLDVIVQFHTANLSQEQTIDYVHPNEKEGSLIHIPPKDNHLCLIYKTLSVSRVHKYINQYCKGYFYNLVCTYCE
ncbi:prolyl 3-hydroxylase OGFOD1-like isoform X1 [Vespa mandarinia]|uniref:prolyl 3-hydroxylase OGFOD1-like isoform X1 n=2 Tax=Vespa mandarinia TaxID=7446 RepID=UPI001621737B|nr:prolyl 3-hydroxylase OGFOD1-like isoform X1 [Vespa mandarinia]XP_035732110.1 prolyl 3-hydroxylase OGFOD1-like isoform X1 [Vespa mandarinia]XP_035732111.1 prolyl 3-hydroxylase OGFOD1-like isoform X1 [Vespa mandarinia]XP_035732112.1 prolyl 3-hydroxylase OGFOD1-like isoform X1 [Vespa mandarinia]XP_035732114.1 prolyl 3-hydroxylase OGFOD1-like isoform X1 [Vespa mandarinia]XP_035732115.1 prolyl 3-hydroxylase OGFOD1-like isoform X1 [Vespa mandarinia]